MNGHEGGVTTYEQHLLYKSEDTCWHRRDGLYTKRVANRRDFKMGMRFVNTPHQFNSVC